MSRSSLSRKAAVSLVLISSLALFLLFGIGHSQKRQTGKTDLDKFEIRHSSGAGNGKRCHDGISDEDGQDVSIVREWSERMMANSFVDPLWQAKVRSDTLRNPGIQPLIEKKCARCHAPMAAFEAEFFNQPVRILGDGFTNPSNLLHEVARQGVGCTLCHQIMDDPDLGTDAGNSGAFKIETFSSPYDRLLYGQFEDVLTWSMVQAAAYWPTCSAQIHEFRVCAACHDLKTPYVDSEGNIVEGGRVS